VVGGEKQTGGNEKTMATCPKSPTLDRPPSVINHWQDSMLNAEDLEFLDELLERVLSILDELRTGSMVVVIKGCRWPQFAVASTNSTYRKANHDYETGCRMKRASTSTHPYYNQTVLWFIRSSENH